MKQSQTDLINKLAHRAKNNLTTMRLAMFNLNHLLASTDLQKQVKDQSAGFLNVLQNSIDESVAIISNILLATRTDERHFTQINLVSILLDFITRSHSHEKFKVEITENEVPLWSDAQALHTFLELLFENLISDTSTEKQSIKIQIEKSNDPGLIISGNFQPSQISKLIQRENKPVPGNDGSLNNLLFHQIKAYLNLNVKLESMPQGDLKIKIIFNQAGGEKL